MEMWLTKTVAYWSAGGPLLIPMVLVCFGIWVCFFRSQGRLRRLMRDGRLLEQSLGRCTCSDEAESVAQTHANEAASFILRALDDVRGGAQPREAMRVRMDDSLCVLRKDFVILTTLTAVAPLIGLLGTVMGMTDTFDAVSVVSGDTGSRVAAGISRALITTQFGLVVALPGVFGIARLRRMMSYTQIWMSECQAHMLVWLERITEMNP